MSGPKKMTAADYLVARGWAPDGDSPAGGPTHWIHPNVTSDMPSTEQALVIQRARDAEEERRVWAAAASATSTTHSGPGYWGDAVLREFRARFAVEIVEEQPVAKPVAEAES